MPRDGAVDLRARRAEVRYSSIRLVAKHNTLQADVREMMRVAEMALEPVVPQKTRIAGLLRGRLHRLTPEPDNVRTCESSFRGYAKTLVGYLRVQLQAHRTQVLEVLYSASAQLGREDAAGTGDACSETSTW